MSYELRPLAEDQLEAYAAQLSRVFTGSRPTTPVDWLRSRIELDRSLAAFDAGGMVGTAGIHSFEMTVPGALPVRCAGVTQVSVLPTHRRQGILRALMRRQLDDIRERGEPLAALYASQAPIYGRFGYGIATWQTSVVLPRGRSALRVPPADRLRVRLVERAEATAAAARLHDAVAATRPGAIRRDARHWDDRFVDLPDQRGGASELNHAVVAGEGGVEGLVSYRLRRNPMHSNGTVRVRDLLATTGEASLALWRYCTGIDLSHRLTAENRPLDEPVRLALRDPRALAVTVRDGVWLRLVDVTAALRARRYAGPGRLVLRVHDAFCPWNEGCHRLEVGEDGVAECVLAEGAPDLELDAGDLASAYLGASSFAGLAAAGLATGPPAALALADRLFQSDHAPWCPTHF